MDQEKKKKTSQKDASRPSSPARLSEDSIEKARKRLKDELGLDEPEIVIEPTEKIDPSIVKDQGEINDITNILERDTTRKLLKAEKAKEKERKRQEKAEAKAKAKEEARQKKEAEKQAKADEKIRLEAEKAAKEEEQRQAEAQAKAEAEKAQQPTGGNVSHVDEDEIAKLKREIALEQGLITPDDVAESQSEKKSEKTLDDVINPTEEEAKKLADEANEDAERRANEAKLRAGDYSIPKTDEKLQEDEEQIPENFDDKKHHLFGHDHGNLPPDKSLPDDITDEEIQELLEDQERQAILAEEQEEEESYEGMTEEEIADAKERRRKFNELKQRYNSKEQSTDGEVGDYKKSLDFSLNTSVKRFRLKPPKKPFIITAIVVAFVMLVSGLTTYFILNKPPAPVVLTSVKISQPSTTQTVWQTVDLSGIYVTETYSDGSTKKVFLTKEMIVSKSSNISDNLVITAYRSDTKITFEVSGKTVELVLNLNERRVSSITAEVFGQNVAGQDITFENIIIWGNLEYYVGDRISQRGEKMWLKDFTNVTLSIDGTQLVKTDKGYTIPAGMSGQKQLTISYKADNNRTLTTTVNITIV